MSSVPNFRRVMNSAAQIDAAIDQLVVENGSRRAAPAAIRQQHDDAPPAAPQRPAVLPARLMRGDDVELEPVRWLWPEFLPAGMLSILGGAPGCGKTTIALSFVSIVTSGGVWPDGSRCLEPGDMLVWSGEDTRSVLAARLVASGADMKRVHFVCDTHDGRAFDPGRDMGQLEAAAKSLSAPRLLILDPIVSAVTGDSHKGAEVRRSLQPVVDMAQRLGCAVLGITHFSKGTSGRDPVERITGSQAFGALARLVLVAAKDRPEPGQEGEPRRMLVRAKSNIGPDDGGFAYSLERSEVSPGVEGQWVRWGDPLDGTARELLAEAEAAQDDGDTTSAGGDAAEFLRDLLQGGNPTLSRDAVRLMKSEGHTDKVIRSAREKLGVIVKREGFGKSMQSLWSLPFVPSAAHSCPVVPTQKSGHEWAGMAVEGTNGPTAADAEEVL